MTEYQLSVAIGQRVREAREKRGLSTQQLAEIAHCAHSTLIQIENGTTIPSVRRLYALARVLQVELCSLFPPTQWPVQR